MNVEQSPSSFSENIMNSVDSLLKTDASSLSLSEKLAIKRLGRPVPHLNIVQNTGIARSRTFSRHFSPSNYDKYDWLCGCSKRNFLFCFPCLLFGNRPDAWSKSGIWDLQHLGARIKSHATSEAHLSSCIEFAFLDDAVGPASRRELRQSLDEHNDKVRRNREVLSRIVDCLKLFGTFRHASDDRGSLDGLMDYVALTVTNDESYRPDFLYRHSTDLQDELLDCMFAVCRDLISKEIGEARYLALIVDDVSYVSLRYDLGIVFRYERDGKAVERFWGFFEVTSPDSITMANCVLNEVASHVRDSPTKLIAQSYDGGAVLSGGLAGVQSIVKQIHPQAHFVHCCSHQLYTILEKAMSQEISQVGEFFSNLSSFPEFFNKLSNCGEKIRNDIAAMLPCGALSCWTYNINTVTIVFKYREQLLQCLEAVETTVRKSTTVREAAMLHHLLHDTNFLFWLSIFNSLQPHLEILCDRLEGHNIDTNQVMTAMLTFEAAVIVPIENVDIEIVDHPVLGLTETEPAIKRPRPSPERESRSLEQESNPAKDAKRKLCNTICGQIRDRFEFTHHLSATNLVDSYRFREFSTLKHRFPQVDLRTIKEVYSPMLEKERLPSELRTLYGNVHFHNYGGTAQLLRLLIDSKLTTAFPEVHKLLQIIVTTPMVTLEAELSLSTVHRMSSLLKDATTQDNLNALGMLAIERELVAKTVNFNEKVIQMFAKNPDRRDNFTFRE